MREPVETQLIELARSKENSEPRSKRDDYNAQRNMKAHMHYSQNNDGGIARSRQKKHKACNDGIRAKHSR